MLRKKSPYSRRTKFLLTTGALVLVNASVAHILVNQITTRTNAQTAVLGTEIVASEGEPVPIRPDTTDESAAEPEAKREITIYTVENGDTISGIAERFHVSVNTIRWANELEKTSTIKVGQKLVILPITGIQYTVKNGDTISGIAHKFDADAGEILSFNDLDDPKQIKPGMKLIIPDAEPAPGPAPKPTTKKTPAATTTASDEKSVAKTTTKSSSGISMPVPGSVLTQGLHDVNAVDLGAPTGTPVKAAKSGTVIVAKGGGAYNGGFGNFIVIDHGGVKTLYAHLSKVSVKVGESVDQGDVIGAVGSTGRSTGPHLHFEVHGASNPWAKNKKGTHF